MFRIDSEKEKPDLYNIPPETTYTIYGGESGKEDDRLILDLEESGVDRDILVIFTQNTPQIIHPAQRS